MHWEWPRHAGSWHLPNILRMNSPKSPGRPRRGLRSRLRLPLLDEVLRSLRLLDLFFFLSCRFRSFFFSFFFFFSSSEASSVIDSKGDVVDPFPFSASFCWTVKSTKFERGIRRSVWYSASSSSSSAARRSRSETARQRKESKRAGRM